MSSTSLGVHLPRCSPLAARHAACLLVALALIACGDNRYRNPARSIGGRPKE
jgi:hypothetical protein